MGPTNVYCSYGVEEWLKSEIKCEVQIRWRWQTSGRPHTNTHTQGERERMRDFDCLFINFVGFTILVLRPSNAFVA